ncbi:hypothetical protein OAU56_03090 [Nitrosopumilus sp.]|jgi:hypothetical protein|nr:hypothetical protein [Nitrosopumilus sp.]MDC1103821.1 hypothetical protein [Nitrosopumilus sp.]MDC3292194.1 hypothetical protein [Nitrosopumilus sp.]MDO7697159.1 hypothetical protein [Nitrosopumilus sp.]|tara:strand:+ start:752 stop:1135 length:384 start_codon:yes stop_codon:yes gene_type:complete
MPGDEIEVPKELREFMLEEAEETILGQKNGAQKQYRYGNLHIREYDDKFLVHTDKIDPRVNPLGHLVHDAPEVLIGLACGIFTGIISAKNFSKNNSKKISLANVLSSSIMSGYLAYTTTKKIKKYLE